jgi:hypothetical protein
MEGSRPAQETTAIAIKRFFVLMFLTPIFIHSDKVGNVQGNLIAPNWVKSEDGATLVATAVLVLRDVITLFDTKGSMTPKQLADVPIGVLARGAGVTLCRRRPDVG